MDPLVTIELIRGIKAGLGWIMALRGGSPTDAMELVKQWQGSRDKSIFGEDLNDILAMTASGVAFLTARGIAVKQAVDMIVTAQAEDRDLTDAEVLEFFSQTDEVAADVEDAIAELEIEELREGLDDDNDPPVVDNAEVPGGEEVAEANPNPTPDNPPTT